MKRKGTPRRKYSFPILTRLAPDQVPKVDAIAKEEHCSRAEVIRRAVTDKIATYEFEPEQK